MNAAECQRLQRFGGTGQLSAIFALEAASAKLTLFVEKQVTRTLTLLHCQSGQRVVLVVKLHHAREIDVAQHIDVMQQERFASSISCRRERTTLLSSGRRRYRAAHPRAKFRYACRSSARRQILHNHVGKVMHVDDDVGYAEGAQTFECNFQQRAAIHLDQRLGRSSVSGRRRVPSPAASTMAFIVRRSPDRDGAPPRPRRCAGVSVGPAARPGTPSDGGPQCSRMRQRDS